MTDEPVRPVAWVGSSKRDFRSFPDDVQDTMGFALYQAQVGAWHKAMKVMKGFGGAGVVELVERSEEHTSELQSRQSISYAVFCL